MFVVILSLVLSFRVTQSFSGLSSMRWVSSVLVSSGLSFAVFVTSWVYSGCGSGAQFLTV